MARLSGLRRKGDLLINWDAVEGLFDPDMLDTMFMDYRALLMRLPKEETIWHENHWRDALSQRINSGAIAEANRTDVAFDESCLHQGFPHMRPRNHQLLRFWGNRPQLC